MTRLVPVPIGALVTRDQALDLLILYESLATSWTSYPFELHAFAVDDEAERMLAGVAADNLRVHRLPGGHDDWLGQPAGQAGLVEASGLERCVISDVANVFVAETPEVYLLLDRHDLVFAGAASDTGAGAGLWAFRRSEGAIAFAREWRSAPGTRDGGPPLALLESARPAAQTLLLARPNANGDGGRRVSAYDVSPDVTPFMLKSDPLGFREARAGRAKVIHLQGIRGRGHASVKDRVEAMIEVYPDCALILPFYAALANRAARKLGVEGLPAPAEYVSRRLLDAGLLAHRSQFATLLNQRGLQGTAVEVGVQLGRFSEHLLRRWKGQRLISIDPWLAAPAEEYEDVSNVDQETHDRYYVETQDRLAGFGDRSEIWRMTSLEAAKRIEPHSLDFAYIDARHDYESVKEDLGLWYDKVRPGGIFAGHDYLDEVRPQGRYGVKPAVDEFFGERGVAVRTTYRDEGAPSWYVEIAAA